MSTNPKITLAELSRQPILVGAPGGFLLNKEDQVLDRDLVGLSIQLRIAEALEKQVILLQAQQVQKKDGVHQTIITVPESKKDLFLAFLAKQPASLGLKVFAQFASAPAPGEDHIEHRVNVVIHTKFVNELFYLGEVWARYQREGIARA
jgi:hypothetical protein